MLMVDAIKTLFLITEEEKVAGHGKHTMLTQMGLTLLAIVK
jgi:hypothetical protein